MHMPYPRLTPCLRTSLRAKACTLERVLCLKLSEARGAEHHDAHTLSASRALPKMHTSEPRRVPKRGLWPSVAQSLVSRTQALMRMPQACLFKLWLFSISCLHNYTFHHNIVRKIKTFAWNKTFSMHYLPQDSEAVHLGMVCTDMARPTKVI